MLRFDPCRFNVLVSISYFQRWYHRFQRYAPRMLRALDICAAPVAEPLLAASAIIAGTEMAAVLPLTFLRRGSKWLRHLDAEADEASRIWEVAVLFHLREAFRSGDIWLAHSRRYGDLKEALIPVEVARATPRLATPFEPETWLADRKARMADAVHRLARAAKAGAIPGGSIEDGILKIDRLTAAVPEDADALVLDLYRRLPEVRVGGSSSSLIRVGASPIRRIQSPSLIAFGPLTQ